MKVFVKEKVKVSITPQTQKTFEAGEQDVSEEEVKILDSIGYLGKLKAAANPSKPNVPAKQAVKKAPAKTKSSS